ncbi:Clustered mitochondria protein-like protein, partial [Fragariocoptes setiger]
MTSNTGDGAEAREEFNYSIIIQAPNLEAFEIQVCSTELVQEIHHILMDREDTCQRTCFSLQLDGVTLDNFAELKNIEGLKQGSIVKVVEEPYTVREARIHLRHVRDLIKSLDPADAYNGLDCHSLSFLNTITQGDILADRKAKSKNSYIDCTPPSYILPGTKDRLLLPLQPISDDHKVSTALKVLTASNWNPPPGHRKLHGDLIYISVVTNEDKKLSITGSTRGFFLNQSTEEEFDPTPASPKIIHHSLIDLLSGQSPSFKRNFSSIQRKRHQKHPFERIATPYQIYIWCAPSMPHTIDSIRAEDTFSSKLGYEENIPGQTRDWNEELQTTRELPRKTLPQRLLRERAVFKVHSDFVAAATRGAMAVIDGNVMAINPGEDTKMQMFIWNSIFFSLGFDVKDHYRELGGDAAAFAAPINDLQGVKAYSAVDVEGLYTLGTVVVDYHGYRVTAQSIIPGILEREQEQSVIYGSVDFGKNVMSHPEYLKLLSKAASVLKIAPHKVANEKGEEIEICSSVECKGIIGNDGRHYILDLLRTFPPDVNYLMLDDEELSKEVQELNYPKKFKHKLCSLRQELIDAFCEAKYLMLVKLSAMGSVARDVGTAKSEAITNGTNTTEEDNKENVSEIEDRAKECTDDSNSQSQKSIEVDSGDGAVSTTKSNGLVDSERASSVVAKMSDFDIRFNPDVFSPGVKHQTSDLETLRKERALVKEAAEFLLMHQIPSFVRDCMDHTTTPIDGVMLSEEMHTRGINIRYLGRVTELLSKVDELSYLHGIALVELISRATKHVYCTYIQDVDIMNLAAAIAHFMNCYLSSCTNIAAVEGAELIPSDDNIAQSARKVVSRRKAKRKRRDQINNHQSKDWMMTTPKSLWMNILQEIESYYSYKLDSPNIDHVVDTYRLHKISFLRSFCLKTGAQILLREYNFDNKLRPTFTEDDLLNVFPIVKHIDPRATDAYNFYTTGQSKIQQGNLKEGHELICEALNLLNHVFGPMHPTIAQCLRMVARLNYLMGDHYEAMAYQQKAVLMSEKVNGIDHSQTITEYSHLALYCFSNGQVTTALKLLYRARYLILLICGENHPDMAVLDSNIGLILHAVCEYDLSYRFLKNALKLNLKFYGQMSMKVAVNYHLVARTQSCTGDFRGALQNEKETYAIYRQLLGPEHEKTKESSECLRHLTQQAVVLAKKLNDMNQGSTNPFIPPINIQRPSMSSVLEMLNIINGILFINIA